MKFPIGTLPRPRRRGLLMAASAAVAVATTMVTVAAPAHAATAWPDPTAAWISPADGTVMEVTGSGLVTAAPSALTAAPGTSPAETAGFLSGGRVLAVHSLATNTMMFIDEYETIVNTGVQMAPGGSPAVAPLGNFFNGGDAMFAFVGTDNNLRTVDVNSRNVTFPGGGPLGVSPGTNPAIAKGALSLIGTVAFHANVEDTLWYVDSNNVAHDTGIKMAVGASPSITEINPHSNAGHLTDYKIAFAGDDDRLRVFDTETSTATGYNVFVAPRTAPAIRDVDANNYKVAFQGLNTHTLWTVTPARGAVDTRLPIAVGTSPSMAFVLPDRFQILFNHGVSHTVWDYQAETCFDTGQPIAVGSNPSTSNVFDNTTAYTPMPRTTAFCAVG
ncbi:MAG: hypothetical protein V7603_4994 [Micromonosporaceae bacterium]